MYKLTKEEKKQHKIFLWKMMFENLKTKWIMIRYVNLTENYRVEGEQEDKMMLNQFSRFHNKRA